MSSQAERTLSSFHHAHTARQFFSFSCKQLLKITLAPDVAALSGGGRESTLSLIVYSCADFALHHIRERPSD
ncbi:hypothetical protein EXA14_07855 [Vibrio cincinnatiensis]|nr:hypothetical protein [Vibrio cincinnatiensis]